MMWIYWVRIGNWGNWVWVRNWSNCKVTLRWGSNGSKYVGILQWLKLRGKLL